MGAGIRHMPTSLARTRSSLTRQKLSIAVILTLLPLSCLASSSANEPELLLSHSVPSITTTATTTTTPWQGLTTCAQLLIDDPRARDESCVLGSPTFESTLDQHQSRLEEREALSTAVNVHHADPHSRPLRFRPSLKSHLGRRAVTPSDDEAGLNIDQTSQTQVDAGIKEEDASNKEEALRNESEKERAKEEERRAEEDARRAKEEEARLKKEEADRDAQAEAERQRVAAENAQKAKAEADRQAAEAARLAKEAADRKAQEDMIRKAQEEADKKNKDQEEADKKKKETEENQKDGDKNSSDEKDGSDADNSRVAEGEGRSHAEATTSDKSKIVVAISIASGGVIVAAFVVGLIFTRARQARKRNSARDAYLTRKVDLDPIYGPAPPFSRMSRNDDRNNGGPIASAMMGSRPSHDNRHSLPCMQDMHHHRHYDEVHDRRDSAWATGMPSLVAAPNPAHLSRISHEIGQKQQHPNQHRHSRQSLVPGSLSKEVFGQQQQQQQQQPPPLPPQQQLHLPHRQQLYGRHSMEPPIRRDHALQEPALANPPSVINHTRRESRPASMISLPRLPPTDLSPASSQNGAPRF